MAAFRVAFGLIVCVGAIRFLLSGWVEAYYVKPSFFFTFDFAPFVGVGSPGLMTAALIALAALGLMVALGLFYRVSIVALVLVFTYLELTDVTNYLNHYYQVALLGALLCFIPAHRAWSLDALWFPRVSRAKVRAWMVWILRFQVGVVYVFAALAKLNSDWLIHAQPLNIWLLARTETPLIGPALGSFEVALAMSWLGFLHDLLIVPALLWRRTRAWAYGVLVVFHVGTGLLFNIGMFPYIMVLTTPVFFGPDWPRRAWAKLRRRLEPSTEPIGPTGGRVPALGRIGVCALALWCLFQISVPARALFYSGPTNWHEQGMRFSWRVMVREKSGSVTYRVKTRNRKRERLVVPSKYLTARQEREFAGQPDLILQLARHIEADFKARGHRDVEVRVDALVSWNGRPPRRLVDPDVDLTKVRVALFSHADWILPAPTISPIRLKRGHTYVKR